MAPEGSGAAGKAGAFDFYYATVCPFAHRAWLTLELLGLPYNALEVDLKNKSPEFLEAYAKATGADKSPNAVAKVPVLRSTDFPEGLAESAVITNYLINLAAATGDAPNPGKLLLKLTPKQQALTDLFVEQVVGNIIKHFYGLLRAQEPEQQAEATKQLHGALADFGAAHRAASGGKGPFFFGEQVSIADILLAPWVPRLVVLTHFRNLQLPQTPELAPFLAWRDAILGLPAIRATTRPDQFYIESYADYAYGKK